MEKERYIVLLENQEKKSLKKVENELQVSITSSEFLSKDNRSFDVIDNDNGVLYKNLGVVVVENMDEDQLKKAVKDDSNPIVYFEKEREFFPADEMKIISELKKQAAEISDKINELEQYLNNKPIPQKKFVEFVS